MTPSAWLIALWSRLLPDADREALRGDLEENLADRRRRELGTTTWLLSEFARTPYRALWKAARRRGAPARQTQTRGGWGMGWGTDLRVAMRTLRRQPGFAGVSIGTIALSVGAATLIFSVFEAVLLRPLPYPEPDELHRVYGTNELWRESEQEFLRRAWDRVGISIEMSERWADRYAVATYQSGSAPVRVESEPLESVSVARVGPDFFRTVGGQPLIGRVPTSEELAEHAPVVVIHEEAWARMFGRADEVLGRSLEIDGTAHEVIGVLPNSFALPEEGVRLWTALPAQFEEFRHSTLLAAVVRIPGDRLPETVADELNRDTDLLAEENADYAPIGVRLSPLRQELLGDFTRGLSLLLGAVGIVVLIACVNLVNLVLARGTKRAPELAMRTALGSGRIGLVRTVLTEVLLVAGIGGALGVVIAVVGLPPLVAMITTAVSDFPRASAVGLNGWVLGFSVAVTLLTGLVAGLPPAWAASRRSPASLMQSGGRGGRTRTMKRVQLSLLFTEAVLATTLLSAAMLVTRSMAELFTLDPGFDAAPISFVSVRFPEESFAEVADVRGALAAMQDELRRVPGVTSVFTASPMPSLGGSSMVPVRLPEDPPESAGLNIRSDVSPGYFAGLGIPLLRGRDFSEADNAEAAPVAILSAQLAQDLFGDEDPIGRSIMQADGAVIVGGRAQSNSEALAEVVGVVGEVRQLALVREDPVLYRPFAQNETRSAVFGLKGDGDASALAGAIRNAAGRVDGVVLVDQGSLREDMLGLIAPLQVRTLLFGMLATLAAALAMVGIYGVVSYVVSDQKREIGIRMALGSRSDGESRRMVRHVMSPNIIGAVIGLGLALAGSRFLESSVYEIGLLDPLSYAAAFTGLLAVAALAAWWPARRASRIDPVEVLRGD